MVCRIYLGKWGEWAYMTAANIIIFGCLMAYYVLMSKFLFGAGLAIHKLQIMSPNDTIESYIDDATCVQKNIHAAEEINSHTLDSVFNSTSRPGVPGIPVLPETDIKQTFRCI